MPAKTNVVMFSGGIGSWACAKRVIEKYGKDNTVLLFSDVQRQKDARPHVGEDEDTYRFIKDAAEELDCELITVADGRDIWDVFQDVNFLGNSRIAHCSKMLKQKPARHWLDTNHTPETARVFVGIDWTEIHRLPAIEKGYLPFEAFAPLTEPPYMDKSQLIDWAKECGLKTPRLYDLGFSHNNCGGGCVRAGQGQFVRLLELMPERYAVWEEQEQIMRDQLGKNVAILKQTRNGVSAPLTLTALREQNKNAPALIDRMDIGGCGCFSESDLDD